MPCCDGGETAGTVERVTPELWDIIPEHIKRKENMPCQRDAFQPTNDERSLNDVKKIKQLESMLCAVLSEITRMVEEGEIGVDDAESFIESAEKNAKLPDEMLKKFLNDHYSDDVKRLEGVLNGLSNHEKELMKRMIEDGY